MNRDKPAVSVILPAFNAEKYIGEAVDSILAQTFTDFELIVVNDGSTDRTLKILEVAQAAKQAGCGPHSRLRIISNTRNLGLSKSLNKGIALACGDYIARQDADDISLPERLGKQYEYLQKHPQVALLGTARKTILTNGAVKEKKLKLQNPAFKDMLQSNCFVHGSVMIRKTALDAVGGYNELFYSSEDYELWLRLTKQFPAANLPEPLYILRRHPDRSTWKSTNLAILYRLLARDVALEKVSGEALMQVHSEGIESYYQRLPDKDKVDFHKRLANTYQRNKRYPEALEQYSYWRRLPGWKRWKAIFYIWSLKLRGYNLKTANASNYSSLSNLQSTNDEG